MKNNLARLATQLAHDKWFLSPSVHANLSKLVSTYMSNPKMMDDEMEDVVPKQNNDILTHNATGIVYVNGVIIKGCSPEEERKFGLCNIDNVSYALDNIAEDDEISDVLIIFNSPGGNTTGVEELGRKIKAFKKPVYGWTEDRSCSSAYWLMSQCQKIGMTPSSGVGAIGCYCLIEDLTKAMENEGVKIEAFHGGKYKMLGHSFKTLTDEEKQILQTSIDEDYNLFKNTVKASRPNVPDEAMQGLDYNGKKALEYGLIDVVVDDVEQFISTAIIKPNLTVNNSQITNSYMENKEVITEAKVAVKAEDMPTATPEVMCPKCKCSFTPGTEPEPEVEEKAIVAETPVIVEAKAEEKPVLDMHSVGWANPHNKRAETNPFVTAAHEMVKSFALNK